MEAINSNSNEEISPLECMTLLNSLLASNPKYLASKLTEALTVAKLTISEDEFVSLSRHRREMENIKVIFADVQKSVESKRHLFKYPDDPQEDLRELTNSESVQKTRYRNMSLQKFLILLKQLKTMEDFSICLIDNRNCLSYCNLPISASITEKGIFQDISVVCLESKRNTRTDFSLMKSVKKQFPRISQ